LWSEDVPGAEIHRRLPAQYGGSALSRRSVYKWIEKFQHVRTSIKDEKKSTTSIHIHYWQQRRGRLCHDSGKPSDYHLFGPLKDALRGRRFTSDEEVKEAVNEWLAVLSNFFCGNPKACGTLEQMHWKAQVLCWKII
jgi:hypothetical protein